MFNLHGCVHNLLRRNIRNYDKQLYEINFISYEICFLVRKERVLAAKRIMDTLKDVSEETRKAFAAIENEVTDEMSEDHATKTCPKCNCK